MTFKSNSAIFSTSRNTMLWSAVIRITFQHNTKAPNEKGGQNILSIILKVLVCVKPGASQIVSETNSQW